MLSFIDVLSMLSIQKNESNNSLFKLFEGYISPGNLLLFMLSTHNSKASHLNVLVMIQVLEFDLVMFLPI